MESISQRLASVRCTIGKGLAAIGTCSVANSNLGINLILPPPMLPPVVTVLLA